MRTPAETLTIALTHYEYECTLFDDPEYTGGAPFMCCIVDHLAAGGVITPHEAAHLRQHIAQWIDHNVSLRVYLQRQGKASDRQARTAFYYARLAELQAEAAPHNCDACGRMTGNVRMDVQTGEVDPDICDACLVEHYPHVNW